MMRIEYKDSKYHPYGDFTIHAENREDRDILRRFALGCSDKGVAFWLHSYGGTVTNNTFIHFGWSLGRAKYLNSLKGESENEMSYEDNVGKKAIAKTNYGDVQGGGRIVAYYPAPTYKIEKEDGTYFHWRADMCEIEEEYTYETSGFYDQSGYVVYGPDGKRIDPWRLVEMLNKEEE